MSYYLLAIGGTGNKILEALVYACAADALYTLDEDATVITGHGPDTRLGDEMRENPFVRA